MIADLVNQVVDFINRCRFCATGKHPKLRVRDAREHNYVRPPVYEFGRHNFSVKGDDLIAVNAVEILSWLVDPVIAHTARLWSDHHQDLQPRIVRDGVELAEL